MKIQNFTYIQKKLKNKLSSNLSYYVNTTIWNNIHDVIRSKLRTQNKEPIIYIWGRINKNLNEAI